VKAQRATPSAPLSPPPAHRHFSEPFHNPKHEPAALALAAPLLGDDVKEQAEGRRLPPRTNGVIYLQESLLIYSRILSEKLGLANNTCPGKALAPPMYCNGFLTVRIFPPPPPDDEDDIPPPPPPFESPRVASTQQGDTSTPFRLSCATPRDTSSEAASAPVAAAAGSSSATLSGSDRLRNYELLEPLGNGVFGLVSKVRRLSDNKILVWKELNYGRMNTNERRMMMNKVQILSNTSHAHIVKYATRPSFTSFL
jgi:hypothetical protein